MNDTGGGALRRGIDIWTVILAVAIVAGAALRFWQLAEPSLAHPEIYIPGIDLLPGISEPPPRHGFFETLQWHFHAEPHPMGYYMAMWVWTSLAGTSEFALRLPGALIGIGTIWLIWRLGKDIFGREVAAVAALLLALHGFHVYWSQLARMYAPAAALAVLATWLLVLWMRSGERRPWLEAGYAATLIAGTQSVEVFWAVPFLHLAWVVLVTPAAEMPGWRDILLPWRAPAHRVMQVQAMAMALAAPEFVHAALLARGGAAPDPNPGFLMEYLGFGFLFETDETRSAFADPPLIAALALVGLTLMLVAFSLKAKNSNLSGKRAAPIAFPLFALAIAAGIAIALFLAQESYRHKALLAVFSVLSFLCLWLPALGTEARPVLERIVPPVMRWIAGLAPFTLLLLMLALIPPPVFYVASFKMSVLASRAFLLFTPFLLLLAAAGLLQVTRGRLVHTVVGVAGMTALFALSSAYYAGRPNSPRDYKGIAAAIARAQRPGDIILVRKRDWEDTPIFYYLPRAQYVAEDQAGYLARQKLARVWLLEWYAKDGVLKSDARRCMLKAAGYREASVLTAERSRASLYVPLGN